MKLSFIYCTSQDPQGFCIFKNVFPPNSYNLIFVTFQQNIIICRQKSRVFQFIFGVLISPYYLPQVLERTQQEHLFRGRCVVGP